MTKFWHGYHKTNTKMAKCNVRCFKRLNIASGCMFIFFLSFNLLWDMITSDIGNILLVCSSKLEAVYYYATHHHHHVVLLARISLTLSRHFSLLFIASGRSSRLHQYPHIAAVCMFELVILLLLSHMWGFIGVHHLWACLCFFSSVLAWD